MAKTAPFETHHRRYDGWFERHREAYESELLAVRTLLPRHGRGLAIGVGTGRFAAPLGVEIGVDPVREMLDYARKRGITAVRAVAEALPFRDGGFDYILSVTTLCFVDDAAAMFAEAYRVLRPGGTVVVGLIDRDSRFGADYLAHQAESLFYRAATFYSAAEVERLLGEAGFAEPDWVQTLYRPLRESDAIESPQPGHGRGGFVVVRARRSGNRRESGSGTAMPALPPDEKG